MKRVIKYISEIIFSVLLIFISYFAWDRIDVEAYERFITQYTLDDVDIIIDDSFNKLSYVSDDDKDQSTLIINNYQNRNYNLNVLLELNGVSDDIVENLVLVVDDNKYSLKRMFKYIQNDKYYFLITNTTLREYEKKSFNLKLLVDDDYEINENSHFSYNIIEEII